jgi:hypothetical protein
MITFKQHLATLKEQLDPDLVATCVHDCSEYFKLIMKFGDRDKLALYRGSSNSPDATAKKYQPDSFKMVTRVLSDRDPVDTDPVIHDLMNDYFEKKFRIPFRNGLMTTPNFRQANAYSRMGKGIFIIVPANGWTLCFGKGVKDTYEQISEFSQVAVEAEDSEEEIVEKFFDRYKYVEGRDKLNAALVNDGEVMLFPKSGTTFNFYAFTKEFYFNKLLPEVKHHL